jgi:hypothetical protein
MCEIRDDNGVPVRTGSHVTWEDHAGMHYGIVESDSTYVGGLKIGGRSVKNVWEYATVFKVR